MSPQFQVHFPKRRLEAGPPWHGLKFRYSASPSAAGDAGREQSGLTEIIYPYAGRLVTHEIELVQ